MSDDPYTLDDHEAARAVLALHFGSDHPQLDAALYALTARGWRPPPPEPDGTHWRTGTSVGRTIYTPHGDLAGLMHTPEQARAVVAALNAAAEDDADA